MTPSRPPRALFVGRATCDVLYRVAELPEENTKVFARQYSAAPGGPALNAALTHARLGGQAMLATAVGGGPWAPLVRGELDRHGVRLFDLAEGTDYQTPLACAWVNRANGSRTVVNPPAWLGNLRPLSEDPAAALPSDWLPLPSVILTDGFLLDESLPLLAACHAQGAALCLDGGSWKPGTERLAPLLKVAICSERFVPPGLDSDPESTLDWLASQGIAHAAVTRGELPILAFDRGRRFTIDIEPIQPVDTLGAGDVLHGAFCFHFAAGNDFESALRQAARLATLSCQGIGIDAWNTQDKY